MQAPLSAAWAVAWRALTGPAREAHLDNRASTPERVAHPRLMHMNQGTLDLKLRDYAPSENRLRTTACSERPQQRLENFGVSALSDTELLAILLRSGTRGHDVLTLASRLMVEAGSIARLASWHLSDFQRLKGIGRIKAQQLVAIMEIARRAMSTSNGEQPILNRAELIASYLSPVAVGLDIEKFWVLCLNRKNRLIKRVEVTSGTATAALAHPREVFRVAIRESSSAIVCAHNHPSGDCAPSSADVQLTRLLREAARTVEIDLLDHVIVGRASADPLGKGWYSFRESGLI